MRSESSQANNPNQLAASPSSYLGLTNGTSPNATSKSKFTTRNTTPCGRAAKPRTSQETQDMQCGCLARDPPPDAHTDDSCFRCFDRTTAGGHFASHAWQSEESGTLRSRPEPEPSKNGIQDLNQSLRIKAAVWEAEHPQPGIEADSSSTWTPRIWRRQRWRLTFTSSPRLSH